MPNKTWKERWDDLVRAADGGPFGNEQESYWLPSGIREGVGGVLDLIQTPGQIIQGERSFGTEQDIINATPGMVDLAMGAYTGGGLLSRGRVDPNMVNAFVYQGGPHKYGPEGAAQSLKHIGKGEGAQAYGWGRYDAGNPAVARQYRKNTALSSSLPFIDGHQMAGPGWFDVFKVKYGESFTKPQAVSAMRAIKKADGNIDNAIKIAVEESTTRPVEELDGVLKILDISRNKKIKVDTPGHLYKHYLPDEDIARYLDWDKPLSEQPESVLEALKNIDGSHNGTSFKDIAETIQAAKKYPELKHILDNRDINIDGNQVHTALGAGGVGRPSKEAAETLRKAGIPGLKYLDGGSRSAGSGSHNYVTWDQDVLNRMTLVERNGEDMLEQAGGRDAFPILYELLGRN